ncbi:tetracycline resistance MFS efflux pump [Reticulibacter mediterranei]|uniref:Tetracycline resistance MFS efflux pump n=1 Tax=Reticulibacter mediterranei TaxID=2778369 RepID=A0A8J3N2A3_9CHLR|nr:MFS transporter [Reticulibacter mediterranei]GHO92087.1 tetracycline resistance MFS efflux pump [Reticulibacter mediterranei]
MEKKKRSPLFLMALTILIDFTGFGLVIPLLPFWAERLGANAFEVGLIITVYALAQLLFTPVLGTLSDRYGRKPIIVASLFIEAVALVMTALANTLPLLLLARFIGGLGASNIGSAQAVVADVTEKQDRAKGMGLIGAAIGLGFVIGPAAGGVLAPTGQTLPFWVAAGVALVNAVLVFLFLPETHKRASGETEQTHHGNRGLGILFSGWRNAARYPSVLSMVLVNLLYTIAFTGMEAIFALFTQHTFGWGASQNGYIFTYIGIIVVIMQGGLVGRLVKRWREPGVLLAGLVLMAVGLISLAFSTRFALLLVTLGILSVGDGAVTPTVSTLLSFASPVEMQGEMLGLSQGVGGLGRIVGPLIAGSLYTFGSALPFVVGGILVILAAIVALPALSAVRRHTRLSLEVVEAQDVAEVSSSSQPRS